MVLTILSHGLNATTRSRLVSIVEALLSIQRFFNTPIAWGNVYWLRVRQPWLDPGEALLMAADEVVVTQSGKKT